MAHYVQLKRNRRVTRLEKILHWSEYEYFKEGFATFASSLTNGGVEHPIKESLKMAFFGQRPHPDLATYVRGYLRFLAVAKATSVEEAIQHGLSCSLAEWRKVAAQAKASLGLDSIGSLFWA